MLYIALRTESNRGPTAKRRFPKDVFVIMPHQRDAGFHRINLDHTHRFGMSVALLMCSLRPPFEWFGRYRYVLFVCQFASLFHYEDLMMLMSCDVGRVHTHMWTYKILVLLQVQERIPPIWGARVRKCRSEGMQRTGMWRRAFLSRIYR